CRPRLSPSPLPRNYPPREHGQACFLEVFERNAGTEQEWRGGCRHESLQKWREEASRVMGKANGKWSLLDFLQVHAGGIVQIGLLQGAQAPRELAIVDG